MNGLLILVTSAALGIEVGWEPLPEGGHEYTIQIEPQLLEVLQRGEDEIFSDVPPELDVRRYRLMVGTGKLGRACWLRPESRGSRHLPAGNHQKRQTSSRRKRCFRHAADRFAWAGRPPPRPIHPPKIRSTKIQPPRATRYWVQKRTARVTSRRGCPRRSRPKASRVKIRNEPSKLTG